jgi:hypothetical protein
MLFQDQDASDACHRVGYLGASQFSREYARFFGSAPTKDLARLREQGLAPSRGMARARSVGARPGWPTWCAAAQRSAELQAMHQVAPARVGAKRYEVPGRLQGVQPRRFRLVGFLEPGERRILLAEGGVQPGELHR